MLKRRLSSAEPNERKRRASRRFADSQSSQKATKSSAKDEAETASSSWSVEDNDNSEIEPESLAPEQPPTSPSLGESPSTESEATTASSATESEATTENSTTESEAKQTEGNSQALPRKSSTSPAPIPQLLTDGGDVDTNGDSPADMNKSAEKYGASESNTASMPTPTTRAASIDNKMVLFNRSGIPLDEDPSTGLVTFTGVDKFPTFQTGNVAISLEAGTYSKTLQLHSAVLARHSAWFASSLGETYAEKEIPVWHSYVLKLAEDHSLRLVRQSTVNGATPQLIKTEELEGASRSTTSSTQSSEIAPGTPIAVRRTPTRMTVDAYVQLFGTFYSIAPSVSTSDVGTALVQSEELIRIAGELVCLPLLRPYLGNGFGEFRQKLYVHIKNDPARWIQLATALENQSIYTECLIHLIGAHPSWPWPTPRKTLAPDLRSLIARKSEELNRKGNKLERELLLNTIQVRRGPVTPQDGHTETWILVQIFRDALATQLHSMQTPKQTATNRGTMYRKIYKGGSEYMEVDEVRSACRNIIQGRWEGLAEDLNGLKEYAKAMVADMAANELMIDPDTHGIGYLTCAKVDSSDVPWKSTG
ncbi:hypothetical protein BCR34DRAFT_597961 [Clohesyomyces aquaticus]|uniref:BTB domain-containing protein n=1 Tax=Clohesyomyces aquaticus TaxID=1231657 RepID=A0A1Y2A1I2_9PLEO|nr:hypothetical protein BCR34DRAFT_597961 [Clohesyomyces aquaticus]